MDEPIFSSHIAAAAAGCPKCKQPLDSMRAVREGQVWTNRCLATGCTGVTTYRVTYEYRENLSAPTSHILIPQKPVTILIPVEATWEFIENSDEWMDVAGNVVPIDKLSLREFTDSVWGIIRANFTKVGSTFAWAKQVPQGLEIYLYPKESMEVGMQYARYKLTEFYEAGVSLGWVTPGSE